MLLFILGASIITLIFLLMADKELFARCFKPILTCMLVAMVILGMILAMIYKSSEYETIEIDNYTIENNQINFVFNEKDYSFDISEIEYIPSNEKGVLITCYKPKIIEMIILGWPIDTSIEKVTVKVIGEI